MLLQLPCLPERSVCAVSLRDQLTGGVLTDARKRALALNLSPAEEGNTRSSHARLSADCSAFIERWLLSRPAVWGPGSERRVV